MFKQGLRNTIKASVLSILIVGCVGPEVQKEDRPFPPPAYADSVAATAMKEGNYFFADRRWEAAKKQYEAAIQAQSSLGEAHFNLALTLHVQGRFSEARPHFVKAAQLEPRNPVIRNAPPFRSYQAVEQDAELDSSHDHSGHHH